MKNILLCVCVLIGFCIPARSTAASFSKLKPVIIGYVGGYRGKVIDVNTIAAQKLTHINYAFVALSI